MLLFFPACKILW